MKRYIAFGLAALAFTGCDKDEEPEPDTTSPVISILEPRNEEKYQQGTNLIIEGTITDNEALGSYSVDIHEGHGHSHKSTVEWEVDYSKNISGTSYTINDTIPIPASADTTEYHVIINAIDAAGNSANFAEVDIEVVK